MSGLEGMHDRQSLAWNLTQPIVPPLPNTERENGHSQSGTQALNDGTQE